MNARKSTTWLCVIVFYLIITGIAMMPIEGEAGSFSGNNGAISAVEPPEPIEMSVPVTDDLTAGLEFSFPEVTVLGGSVSAGNKVSTDPAQKVEVDYLLNTDSLKFHYTDCYSARLIIPENRENFAGSREEAMELGYAPCQNCNP